MRVVQAATDVPWASVAVAVVVVLTALGVNVHAQALSTCDVRASHCLGVSCCKAQGVRASVIVTHRHSCPVACGIFPDQGWNPCPLHWQEDS